MAAATPARLVAALHAAAREAGWTVDAVSPAEGAWCSAATALWPATSRNASHLLVCSEDRTELLQIEQGKLAGLRRFRGGAADAALVVEAIRIRRRISEIPCQRRGTLRAPQGTHEALATAGMTVSSPPAEWAERADHADLLAAEFAGPNAAPLLRSEATLATKREQARRTIMRIAAASVVLLLVASGLTLWGAKRQLRAVQADRAVIKPLISATLVGRTSVENAFRQLSALAATQRTAPQWSDVISNLGVHLADGAYLTSLRARDDSLLVEGVAVSAARAFDSMYQTPGLVNVKAAAPVRRESPQGGPALERFTIGAVVAHPVSNAVTPPAAANKVSP